MLNWIFKIELIRPSAIEQYEEMYGKAFPEDLNHFIEENNAASPDKRCIKINDVERVFLSVLSFNMKEEDALTFNDVYSVFEETEWIPFARDPFGNYFCYDSESHKIGFYNHEQQACEITDMTLQQMVDNLYEIDD